MSGLDLTTPNQTFLTTALLFSITILSHTLYRKTKLLNVYTVLLRYSDFTKNYVFLLDFTFY
ncbi:hypothetical protein BpHYR1_012215, partial [Brachionus plicatilis]